MMITCMDWIDRADKEMGDGREDAGSAVYNSSGEVGSNNNISGSSNGNSNDDYISNSGLVSESLGCTRVR
jgi:hypothetical protein